VFEQPFVHRGATWAFASNWDLPERQWPEVIDPSHLVINPTSRVKHVFVICSPENEPEQHAYLQKALAPLNAAASYWAPTYGALTADQMIEFNIQTGLTIGEESLEYNFFSLAKFISQLHEQSNTDRFLVLESDAILQDTFADFLSKEEWPQEAEAIHIGAGCGDPSIDIPKCEAEYCPMPNTRCSEAILWSVAGLRKMLSRQTLSKPVDLEIDLAIQENGLQFWWSKTSHVLQGSKTGVYASTVSKSFKTVPSEPSPPWRVVAIVLGALLAVFAVLAVTLMVTRGVKHSHPRTHVAL
jgi:hypothetical protein